MQVEGLPQSPSDALTGEGIKKNQSAKLKGEHETRIREMEDQLKREQTIHEEMEQNQRLIEMKLKEGKTQVSNSIPFSILNKNS